MRRITSKSRCAAVVTLSLATCLAADKPKEAFHNFNVLDVEKFENPNFETKEPMPSAWVATIQEDIVRRVIELHKCRRIMDFEDSKAGAMPPLPMWRTIRYVPSRVGASASQCAVSPAAGISMNWGWRSCAASKVSTPPAKQCLSRSAGRSAPCALPRRECMRPQARF